MKKMIGFLFVTALLTITSFAQETVNGRWKPVYISLDNIILVDIIAEKVTYADTLQEILKHDANPEESKKMFEFLGSMMLDKMKSAVEAYQQDTVYLEINTKTGRERTGSFQYDATSHTLTRMLGSRKDIFAVAFVDGMLELQGELGNKEGQPRKILVRYKKEQQ